MSVFTSTGCGPRVLAALVVLIGFGPAAAADPAEGPKARRAVVIGVNKYLAGTPRSVRRGLEVRGPQPRRMHGELVEAIREASGSPTTQIGGYLKILIEKFRLIERKLPVFAKPEAKRSRYYMTDNFLRSWLAALANPVSAIAFRPLDELVDEADRRLMDVEGGALEKLVGQLYEERSRKGIGDFPLTHRIQGYWDKADTEIDLVAINETEKVIRFGSCKRSPHRLLSGVNTFKMHVERFLQTLPQYRAWTPQYVGISPVLNSGQRVVLRGHKVIAEDLVDLTFGFD